MWNRNFYGGHLVLCKLGVFGPGYFDGNIPILKEEIHTVILIPLWLCPGGGGCTWDPGGPRTICILYVRDYIWIYLLDKSWYVIIEEWWGLVHLQSCEGSVRWGGGPRGWNGGTLISYIWFFLGGVISDNWFFLGSNIWYLIVFHPPPPPRGWLGWGSFHALKINMDWFGYSVGEGTAVYLS